MQKDTFSMFSGAFIVTMIVPAYLIAAVAQQLPVAAGLRAGAGRRFYAHET